MQKGEDVVAKHHFDIYCSWSSWCPSAFSVVSSILSSFTYPLFGVIFSELVFIIMQQEDATTPHFIKARDQWCQNFLCWCILMGLVLFLQKWCFLKASEHMTCEVRCLLFEALVYKQPAWFDSRKGRSAAQLTSLLQDDVGKLNGLTTEHTATKLEAFLGVVLGVAIAMAKNWTITVIIVALTPLTLIGGTFASVFDQIQKNKRENPLDAYHSSNVLLKDLILNYRTVKSFSQPNIEHAVQRFTKLLEPPTQTNIKHAHAAGVAFGYSLCIRFVYIGLVFLIGARLARSDPDLTFKDIFQSIYIVFVSLMGATMALTQIPGKEQAQDAARTIFGIIDEPSACDVRKEKPRKEITHGEIEFEDVTFKYPTADQPLLKNFSMKINPGTRIGLVGHSGCGKSTIINLLLKYYDINGGRILLDGVDIGDYDIASLRR